MFRRRSRQTQDPAAESAPDTAPGEADDSGKPKWTRPQVVQAVLDLFDAPDYLEIGVFKGKTFHRLEAASKVAVDPNFQFDLEKARADHPRATYHQVPSDEYFGTLIAPGTAFDVVYIDGLHTFEQTLRDFHNALAFLRPGGVIVIDDVRPSSYLASLREQSGFRAVRKATGDPSRNWMGDVYKLLWFLDTFHQQLTYRTVEENHGQAVVWQEPRTEVAERRVGETDALTFEDLILQNDVLRLAPMEQILSEVRAARDE